MKDDAAGRADLQVNIREIRNDTEASGFLDARFPKEQLPQQRTLAGWFLQVVLALDT